MSVKIEPGEGRGHVACTTCGFTTTVPLDRMEPTPWCVHNGSTYVWRDPRWRTQTDEGQRAWTRMIRVDVFPVGSAEERVFEEAVD